MMNFISAVSENSSGSSPAVIKNAATKIERNRSLPTILVVDDDALIADTLVEILNSNGYMAMASYGGANAIELAENYRPDIVLSDVLMPDVNGIEVAYAVRKSCPHTRILLFSGQAATSELLVAARFRAGDFELLPKPIHPTVLLKTLRGAT